MHEFLKILSKILAEKRSKSLNAASAEKEKPENSKESLSLKLDINDRYIELAQRLYIIRLAYVSNNLAEKPVDNKNKLSENHRKILKSTEFQLHKMFEKISKNLANVHFDIVISFAASYALLGDILLLLKYDLSSAEKCFNKTIKLLKGKELDPKAILTVLHAHQMSRNIYANPDKSYTSLITTVSLYRTYTKDKNHSVPGTFIDIFNFEDLRHFNFETDAKAMLDDRHISDLKELIKLYDIFPNNKHKFVLYMHKLLKDYMEETLVQSGHIEWAIACASLATYFIHNNRFTEAKSHLVIANKVLAEYNDKACVRAIDQDVSLTFTPTETSETKQKIQYADNRLELQWGLYGTSLLRVSKNRMLEVEENKTSCKTDDLNSESLLLFDEKIEPIVYLNATKQSLDFTMFTDQYVENYNDAFKVFTRIYESLRKIIASCKKNNELHRSGEASLYISRLHKYMPYFESDTSKKVQWYNSQIKFLESALKDLNETNNQDVMRIRKILWLEMSVAYSTVINMSEETLARAGEDNVEKTIGLCVSPDKILDCFIEFFTITLDDKDRN